MQPSTTLPAAAPQPEEPERPLPLARMGLWLAMAWQLSQSWVAVRHGFGDDDLMNLYKAWEQPGAALAKELLLFWTSQTRPIGGLWYQAVYAAGGMNPLWPHLLQVMMNLGGLLVLYRIVTRLPLAPAQAGAALLVAAFHAPLWDIYVNTGMVYDVLVSLFLWGAMAWVMRFRAAGLAVPARVQVGVGVLQWAAVGSKELGVVLPGLLLAYEVFVAPRGKRRWGHLAAPMLLSVVFAGGRTLVEGPLSQMPAYRATVQEAQMVEGLRFYTGQLLQLSLSAGEAAMVWAGLAALAVLLRSRVAAFGLAWFVVAMAPMLLVPTRHSAYPMYLGWPGLALAGVVLLSEVALAAWRAVRRRTEAGAEEGEAEAREAEAKEVSLPKAFSLPKGRLRRVSILVPTLVPLVVALAVSGRALAVARQKGALYPPNRRHEHYGRCLRDLRLPLRAGSKILVVDSPVEFEWIPLFLLGLHYHEKHLQVRSCAAEQLLDGSCVLPPPYDHVVVWSAAENRFVEIADQSRVLSPQTKVEANGLFASYYLRRGFGALESGAWRWAEGETELRFGWRPGVRELVLDLVHAGVVEKAKGPLRLQASGEVESAKTEVAGEGRHTVRLPIRLRDEGGEGGGPGTGGARRTVTVRLQVENALALPEGGKTLGFILYSARLE